MINHWIELAWLLTAIFGALTVGFMQKRISILDRRVIRLEEDYIRRLRQ